MPRKLFLSYAHADGHWVWKSLLPVLRAAGEGSHEVLIDKERFQAGIDVVGQMDAVQDQAETSLLVLTPSYLKSKMCQHEMERAAKRDRTLRQTPPCVLPIVRERVDWPDCLRTSGNPTNRPLFVDLKDDEKPDPWMLLLETTLGATGLGVPGERWLKAARRVVQIFGHEAKAVNLVTSPDANWRALFQHVLAEHVRDWREMDLNDPTTVTRDGFLRTMLHRANGYSGSLPRPPRDMVEFGNQLAHLQERRLAIRHFDAVIGREREYTPEIFRSLLFASEKRQLVLLVHSRQPYRVFLPANHPISKINFEVVEL